MRVNKETVRQRQAKHKDRPIQLKYFVNEQISRTHHAVKRTKKVTSETRINYGSRLEVVDKFNENAVTMSA